LRSPDPSRFTLSQEKSGKSDDLSLDLELNGVKLQAKGKSAYRVLILLSAGVITYLTLL